MLGQQTFHSMCLMADDSLANDIYVRRLRGRASVDIILAVLFF